MQFKKQIFFLFLLVNFKALGQVTTQELFPNAENEITIIVDLKKAKDSRATGLLGKSSDVYLWSGAGATETGSAFQYQPSGQTNFTAPFEKGKMTSLGNDVWSIKLIPRSYFSVPSGTPELPLKISEISSAEVITRNEPITYEKDLGLITDVPSGTIMREVSQIVIRPNSKRKPANASSPLPA
jgi:hypothetical protein